MNRCRGVATWLLVILVASGLALASCAGTKPKPGELFTCVSEEKLDKTITPDAELVEFLCLFKKWSGSETLHFKVTVKNVSNQPQRFKVNIFLDNDKAVGGLIPIKIKKGLLKPGQIATFIYPVQGMDKKPNAITLIIKTIGE